MPTLVDVRGCPLRLADLVRVALSIGLAAAALGAPLDIARAEEMEVLPRLGWVGGEGTLRGFRAGLEELGYVEGENILMELRVGASPEQYPELVEQLIALGVDVLASGDSVALTVAKEANISIPVVMVGVGNPITSGLVTSFERPGGNFTGTTSEWPAQYLEQLGLLKQAFPEASRLMALFQAGHPLTPPASANLRGTAGEVGIEVQVRQVGSRADIEAAFEAAWNEGAEGFYIARQPITGANQQRIVELATESGRPTLYPTREWTVAGGLISYGIDSFDLNRRAAAYVDRILQGADPAELPVEGPDRFELVVNLKAAQALGFSIPESVLARATEVIE